MKYNSHTQNSVIPFRQDELQLAMFLLKYVLFNFCTIRWRANKSLQRCSDFPVLQVPCCCVRISYNELKMSAENSKVVPGWHDGATAALSQIAPSLRCTSICLSLSVFLPGSVLQSARIMTLSSICHITGSALSVSNDPDLSHIYSILSVLKHLTLFSHLHLTTLPISSSVFPSSYSFLFFLLPTHSFSIHIIEDIYEHETECVRLHHFQSRGNLHFSPVPPSSSLSG